MAYFSGYLCPFSLISIYEICPLLQGLMGTKTHFNFKAAYWPPWKNNLRCWFSIHDGKFPAKQLYFIPCRQQEAKINQILMRNYWRSSLRIILKKLDNLPGHMDFPQSCLLAIYLFCKRQIFQGLEKPTLNSSCQLSFFQRNYLVEYKPCGNIYLLPTHPNK